MKQTAVIIGGGIGGLFTGAFLAKNGYSVTVLEKNSIIGGGLQCFHRKGKSFETGMHIMGGFGEGGTLHRICSYLGILHRLDIQHIPDSCMDEVYYRDTDERYRLGGGREGFTESLCSYFPQESDNIRRYIDAIYRLSHEVPLFRLLPEPDSSTVHSDEFFMPVDEFIASYVTDRRLRDLLAYLSPLYGGHKGETPAYIHALINVLYINGSSRFIGGSQQLADALAEVITDGGGRVISGREVTAINVEKQMVTGVVTADGHTYTADRYISSVHPLEMLRIVTPGTFLKAFRNRMAEIPNSYSAFSLYIDLRPGCLPYIDHTCYEINSHDIWNQHTTDPSDWPAGFMYMTPPEPGQGEYASRMLVHCIMSFNDVRRWQDTTPGHRTPEYEAWKQEKTERVLDRLERIFPGFRSMTNAVYASSPLTIRDYYHTPEGSIFGFRKNCNNLMLTQIPVYTRVKNLLLTGQSINLHGICGVPLTAINTAEAILGKNRIINQINEIL